MTQTELTVTPTQSRFVLHGGGVELTVTFMSPIEPGDLRRQSMPLSYISMQARSLDGKAHRVSLYVDISAEWAHGDSNALVGWDSASSGGVRMLSFTPASPGVLAEHGDMASWGTSPGALRAARLDLADRPGTVVRSTAGPVGGDGRCRAAAWISDRWPVLASPRLGSVRAPRNRLSSPSATFHAG